MTLALLVAYAVAGCGGTNGMACPTSNEECVPGSFITVVAGTFTMGSSEGEPGHNSEETQHTVTLSHSFVIQSTEVTQAQFKEIMAYNTSHFLVCGEDCPAESISWFAAAAYTNALSAAVGLAECYTCTGTHENVTCEASTDYASPYDCPGYRLPTEAEWEYAARAGATTSTYNGTIDVSHMDCEMPNTIMDPIAWFCGNSPATTHPVGRKNPNEWGLYDMLGNVMEWCNDWYSSYSGDTIDPWGPPYTGLKVIRGGSWDSFPFESRAASRKKETPNAYYSTIGFRPVRTLP